MQFIITINRVYIYCRDIEFYMNIQVEMFS